MEAILKNSISQLMLAATLPVPKLFDDSTTPVRTMDLEEAKRFSRFMPVMVLAPASLAEEAAEPKHGPGNDAITPKSGMSRLFEWFGNTSQALANAEKSDFAFGDVKVSFSSMETSRKGEPVILRLMEFKTLKYFAQNARRVVSRDELLNQVWGYEHYPCTRTVDNHILKLRQKLEKDPSRPIHFQTVRGVGYKFLPDCLSSEREPQPELAGCER